jgi:hypothetical protein|uniref:Uncharacterized protein n=1 Tax=Siphoviridae sp. ctTPJ4 TaxID=2825519 RepID=A0A8S5V0M4_9CAUD|nr:MAG TPA: hypothetical protein [Siphoviridae sp. ctTPJ4]
MKDTDVQVIYRDVDRESNTVRVALKVPNGTDPEIAKAIFLEAIKNTQEDRR